jgi:hypothetical protein
MRWFLRNRRSRILAPITLGIVALGVASCGYPLAGGMIAGGMLLGAILFGALSFSSGCGSKVGPCLSPPGQLDGRLDGKGLDAQIGPCLKPLPPDFRQDTAVGPCLKISPDFRRDTTVGPCLDPYPWDGGRSGENVGPCLSPPSMRSDPPLPAQAGSEVRPEIIDRLQATGVISEELAARLKRLAR